ncbi:uncharacterized protein METZ01_LOCUS202529 [marine metagenome]|uniref:PhoD-like phosphatase metallophosphatase domain-containing protein n=1 Tax=marine metagenome TaxID=408172 RepID=A0A382EGT3_9ZZZZ
MYNTRLMGVIMAGQLHFIRRLAVILLPLFFFTCGNNDGNEPGPKNIKIFSPRSYDHLANHTSLKIGFGSCLDQDKSMIILDKVKEAAPDIFLMIGDNVYGDTPSGALTRLESAYAKQKENFSAMNPSFPIEAIWDDHDYGINDGGIEHPNKEEAETMFFDFWEINSGDIRRTRPGLYWEQRLQISGKTVQIITLDTRYFRDPLDITDEYGADGKERYLSTDDTTRSMLGISQWLWLEEKLQTPADYRLIISSIQFLAVGHGWECWRIFPHERDRLVEMLDEYDLDNVLFLTGDRHRGGLYQLTTQGGNTIHEITSSPLNATTFPGEEDGPLRLGATYTISNFGLITIDTSQNTMLVELKDGNGENVNSFTINLGS